MLPEEQYQQIEAWLDGLLTDEALASFEVLMRDDPAFAAEAALHKMIRQTVLEKDIGAFRETLDMLLSDTEGSSEPSPRTKTKLLQVRRFIWAIAAALLLAVAAILFFTTKRQTPEQLYADAFHPPVAFRFKGMSVDAVRDTSVKNIMPDWVNLNDAWAGKRTEEALQNALKIAQTDTSRIRSQSAYYAAGVIALSDQRPEEALEYLDKAGKIEPYEEDILWYQALAHVQITLKDASHRPKTEEALNAVLQGRQPENRHQWAEKMLRAFR